LWNQGFTFSKYPGEVFDNRFLNTKSLGNAQKHKKRCDNAYPGLRISAKQAQYDLNGKRCDDSCPGDPGMAEYAWKNLPVNRIKNEKQDEIKDWPLLFWHLWGMFTNP
jgi:hypothetical protein